MSLDIASTGQTEDMSNRSEVAPATEINNDTLARVAVDFAQEALDMAKEGGDDNRKIENLAVSFLNKVRGIILF